MLATLEAQQLLHQYSVDILSQQIEVKFKLKTARALQENLSRLSLEDLQALFRKIFSLKSLAQLRSWVEHRLASKKGHIPALAQFVGILSTAEAQELNQIIDNEFERIDPHGW